MFDFITTKDQLNTFELIKLVFPLLLLACSYTSFIDHIRKGTKNINNVHTTYTTQISNLVLEYLQHKWKRKHLILYFRNLDAFFFFFYPILANT